MTYENLPILGIKASFNTFQRIEITQFMFSGHGEIKLEINSITGKSPKRWRLKNTVQNYTWVKKEISGEVKKFFELNENENITY